MIELSIDTIDEIHRAFIRLETVTYLQTLVRLDDDHSESMELGLKNANDALFIQQREAVANLHALLFSEPFC